MVERRAALVLAGVSGVHRLSARECVEFATQAIQRLAAPDVLAGLTWPATGLAGVLRARERRRTWLGVAAGLSFLVEGFAHATGWSLGARHTAPADTEPLSRHPRPRSGESLDAVRGGHLVEREQPFRNGSSALAEGSRTFVVNLGPGDANLKAHLQGVAHVCGASLLLQIPLEEQQLAPALDATVAAAADCP